MENMKYIISGSDACKSIDKTGANTRDKEDNIGLDLIQQLKVVCCYKDELMPQTERGSQCTPHSYNICSTHMTTPPNICIH